MRSRLIKALNNRFCVKFMQFETGLLRGRVFWITAGVSVDSTISSSQCPAIGSWMAGLEIALSPF